MRFLSARALILFLALAAGAAVLLRPSATLGFVRRTKPFSTAFFQYQNWKHPWMDAKAAGEGRPARELKLAYPMGLAIGHDGSVYIGDRLGRFIWRIGRDGRAHVFAGTGRRGAAEPAAAREVNLGSPEGIALDPRDGSLAIADSFNHVILRVKDGYVERIAGTGESGYSGDGGPAVHARLARPYDVAFNSRGELFIADYDNNRIRKIGMDGTITTFAGGAEPGYSGDGGPVSRARIRGPWSVAVDGNDSVLIADSDNHVIRSVGKDGVIRTIAGRGQRGREGDGGPALKASFDTPQAMLRLRDGRLLIDDEHNNAIRVLERDGTVKRLMGAAFAGRAAEGAPAASAALNDPENVLELPDGTLLIADGANGRVLRVGSDGRVRVFAGPR
ncbi:MAG TPA: hypothetical protein VN428_06745 [Bryobacteraceae bacterium]|nr:hypothetical protein [Bryobacteraceae bacterium]